MPDPSPDTSMTVIGSAQHEGAFSLWEKEIYGESVTVAVLDSGMNEDGILSGHLAWRVDLTGEDDVRDSLGHGTHMGQHILWYAPKARIASVKVVDKNGLVTREGVARGLEYCAEQYPEIRVVNVSLGIRRRLSRWVWCTLDRPCTLCSKVNEVAASGLIVVAAAGNRSTLLPKSEQDTVTCPGNAEHAFTVGAVEHNSSSRHRSNWLRKIAPSVYYRRTGTEAGTSLSTASSSGGMALLLSAIPDVQPEEIREASRITATGLVGPNPYGTGMANWYGTYKLIRHKRNGRLFDVDRSFHHYQAGLSLRESGDNRGSINEFRQAVEFSPTGQVLHNELGLAYLREGMNQQAVEWFQEAVRLYFPSAIPHDNLGLALYRLNQKDKALRHFEIALRIDPRLKQAVLHIWHLMQGSEPPA